MSEHPVIYVEIAQKIIDRWRKAADEAEEMNTPTPGIKDQMLASASVLRRCAGELEGLCEIARKQEDQDG